MPAFKRKLHCRHFQGITLLCLVPMWQLLRYCCHRKIILCIFYEPTYTLGACRGVGGNAEENAAREAGTL